jgi:transposase
MACDRSTGSRQEIAERFNVSTAWIRRLLQRRRDTGTFAAKPSGAGRPAKYTGQALEKLQAEVRKQPDATLKELRARTGALGSIMAVDRALQRLSVRLKKSRSGPPSRTDQT